MKRDDTALDLSTCVQALQDVMTTPAEAVDIAERALALIMLRHMGGGLPVAGRKTVKIPDGHPGSWAKWVLRVNDRESGSFAFEGPFLRLGSAVPLPPRAQVLLVMAQDGVGQRTVFLFRVTENGMLDTVYKQRSARWWPETKRQAIDWLSIRPTDEAAAALAGPVEPPDRTAL